MYVYAPKAKFWLAYTNYYCKPCCYMTYIRTKWIDWFVQPLCRYSGICLLNYFLPVIPNKLSRSKGYYTM